MNIDGKLKKIKEEYTEKEDQETIREWEQEAKINNEFIKLQDNFAVKILLKQFKNSIDSINERLMNDENLLNEDGRLLVREKRVYEDMINNFAEAKKNNDLLEKEISSKL